MDSETNDSQATVLSDPIQVVVDSLTEITADFLERLPLIAAGVGILVLTWVFSWIAQSTIRSVLSRTKLRTSLKDLFRQITTAAVWIVGIMIASIVVFPGMTPAKILTVLGLSSVALGFAFKDIFENFFAGVLILWRFPFENGDYIRCGDIEGTVEDTTIRMTNLRRVDGTLIIAPNALLFKEPVQVLTSWASRRVTIICGIAYGESIAKGRELIQAAVEKCKSIHSDRPVEVYAQEFASSSINFEVTWWTDPKPQKVRQSRDEVVEAIKSTLDDNGIEIPFPYRTLTFKEPLQVNQSDSE